MDTKLIMLGVSKEIRDVLKRIKAKRLAAGLKYSDTTYDTILLDALTNKLVDGEIEIALDGLSSKINAAENYGK